MSLTINKKNGILDDVVFCYTKMRDPVLKYQSKTEREFTVDCVVDKTTAKEWKKTFKKNPVKEFDDDEFEEIFKIEPPFDNGTDEQYVIKLKAPAQDKKGNPKPAKFLPSVLVPNEDEDSDADYVNVTDSVLVANGSSGKVAFNILSNDFGTFPQLNAILVEDLIEYEEAGAGSAFGGKVSGERSELDEKDYEDSDKGDVEEGSEDVTEAPEEEVEEKPAKSSRRKGKKSSTKTEQEPEEEFDDDIPF